MINQWSRRDFLRTAGIISLVPTTLAQQSLPVEAQISARLTSLSEGVPNAEPRVHELVRNWITPTSQFYIRSHAPAPKIDLKSFRLSVEGLVEQPLQLPLDQLRQKYDRTYSVCTMTCAGNRRTELHAIKPIKGVPWGPAAIGNAEWSGFRLSDVLKTAGLQAGAKHVWFEGLDEVAHGDGTIPFGGSIPVEKALNDSATMPGAIVCDTMNGRALTPDHGFPLRMVVPGFIGARSVKWVGKIVVSDRPSPNHYLANAYKLLYENTPDEIERTEPIYEYAINSVIANPNPLAPDVKPGQYSLNGYALPPGKPGVTINKIEVSTDGGKSWNVARLTSRPREYCWQLWSVGKVQINTNQTVIVRATDSQGNLQPETIPWNHKGYMMNAWHKVTFNP